MYRTINNLLNLLSDRTKRGIIAILSLLVMVMSSMVVYECLEWYHLRAVLAVHQFGQELDKQDQLDQAQEQAKKEPEDSAYVEAAPHKDAKTADLKTLAAFKDPWDDLKYKERPKRVRDIEEIRKDDFGVNTSHHIPIWLHKEQKSLDAKLIKRTIRAVILRMPNLKSTPELYALLYETLVVETLLGRYTDCNQGIAQFTYATGKETVGWLKTVRPDVYQALMDLYKKDLSLLENLRYNVPFSIALMAQYYWKVAPDLYQNIQTVEQRARLWKASYNTHLGKGTVNIYLDRNKYFQRQLDKAKAKKDTDSYVASK